MVVILGLAMVMGAAACGGTRTAAKAAPVAESTTTTTTEPGAAYTACLRDHGVTAPDRPRRTPGTDSAGSTVSPPSSRPPGSRPSTSLPEGVDQAALAAARQACQSLQPADRPNANGPQGQAFQAYASCMKDHGVTVGNGGGPGGGGANRDDPAFKAADAICAPLRPAQPQP